MKLCNHSGSFLRVVNPKACHSAPSNFTLTTRTEYHLNFRFQHFMFLEIFKYPASCQTRIS